MRWTTSQRPTCLSFVFTGETNIRFANPRKIRTFSGVPDEKNMTEQERSTIQDTSGSSRLLDCPDNSDRDLPHKDEDNSIPLHATRNNNEDEDEEDEEEKKQWRRETLQERLKRCGVKTWPPPPSSYQHLIPKQSKQGPSRGRPPSFLSFLHSTLILTTTSVYL
jgi:hypothetical protein